ncbi:hypothetical protein [uncultured Pseudomonas sp.]|uniref:hypothetical protein n=1 Tax=uncultured Pseudomonas sp. TaxID=114707 RepID=UPI0025FEB814|nr:hypothetical protein [uncultured Pseudomonas sp.]
MPAKDRHGKTAQDYRSALITELDAVPDYRRRKPRRSPLLLVWLLVPIALLWLNWNLVAFLTCTNQYLLTPKIKLQFNQKQATQ